MPTWPPTSRSAGPLPCGGADDDGHGAGLRPAAAGQRRLALAGWTCPLAAWPALLGLGLVATAIAIQTFYAGVKRVGGARASLISTVEPVYTVVLAMILFGERLTPMQIAGRRPRHLRGDPGRDRPARYEWHDGRRT